MASGILSSLGGLGLFLLGMVVMTSGLKSLAGDALRRALARFTKSPFSGAVTGAASTAVIQSSSATTVTAVGFVGAGLMTFSQALGIIFGANIGTTLTGWAVAIFGFKLRIGELALPLILIGVLLHLLTKRRLSSVGLAICGFGLVFVGISALQEGMKGLEGVITPANFPDDSLGGRLLLVLIGIGVTLVTQSSSAGVATALAAVYAGSITFPQAAAMVIGMDVGTTATAAIATIGGSTEARRTGIAHVVYNLLTGIGAFCLLTPYAWACEEAWPGCLQDNAEIALVGFHSLFNTLGVLIVLPFTNTFARLIIWLVPGQAVPYTQRLDRSLYESPAIAIEAVRATLNELAVAVFRHLDAALKTVPELARDDNLEDALRALDQTREYLERVDTSTKHDVLYPRLARLIHVIDHLRRLIDRCCEPDRIRLARESPDLAESSRELKTAISSALAIVEANSEDADAAGLRSSWQNLEDQAQESRAALVKEGEIALSPSGAIDANAVLEKLDALRWIRRVSYHIWRIVHHLERSQLDQPESQAEEIPAYREQEVD